MDRFESMRAYARVVELGGLAPAGRALGISPSMVAKHLDALEARIGARLLTRTTRLVRPTEAGQAYYESCVSLLAGLEEAEAAAGSEVQRPSGTLRITAPVEFGNAHLSGIVAHFMAAHPELNVGLDLTNRVVSLVEEGFDVAVRIASALDTSLVGRRIATSRFHIVASPAWVARHGRPARPQLLEGAEALCFGVPAPWDRWSFAGESGACTVRVRPKLLSTSAEALRIAAVDGMGLALLPSFVCGADLRRGALVSLFDQDSPGALIVHALYPDRRFLPARVRLFIDHLARSLGGDGNADPWDGSAAEDQTCPPGAQAPGHGTTHRE